VIHTGRADGVFAAIAAILDGLAPVPRYRSVFDRAVARVRSIAAEPAPFLPIDLPLAVADVLARPAAEADAVAAASAMLWAGADLMDDVADRQLDGAWSDVPGSILALVSTNLLSTLPHLLVGELDDGACAALYSQAVSQTLFTMSEGQAADLEGPAAIRTVDDYLTMIRKKSGAEFALFASTPAMLAGADGQSVAAWARFGLSYGMMAQAFTDIASTLAEDARSDLLAGKRSLPVLFTLQTRGDGRHSTFVSDLDKASHGDQIAAARAVECMTEAGAIRASFEQVELMRFRAMQSLPVKLTELRSDHALRLLLGAFRVI
jgi:geranylgeranyl pyrophosphate synthase